MRVVVLIAALALLGACQDEPDFDTRYDKAAKEIDARAKAMDAGIAESSPQGLPDTAGPSNASTSSGE
jgi:hypothetical protein